MCFFQFSVSEFYNVTFFFHPHPWHVEVPGPGIRPEPRQWQCRILNLLSHQGTPDITFSRFLCLTVWLHSTFFFPLLFRTMPAAYGGSNRCHRSDLVGRDRDTGAHSLHLHPEEKARKSGPLLARKRALIRKQILLEPWSLIFQAPELWEYEFLLFKPQSQLYLVMIAQTD